MKLGWLRQAASHKQIVVSAALQETAPERCRALMRSYGHAPLLSTLVAGSGRGVSRSMNACTSIEQSAALFAMYSAPAVVSAVHHEADRGRSISRSAVTRRRRLARSAQKKCKPQQDAGGDADYVFDIPIELARTLTGFRYDESPSVETDPWESLEEA